MIETTLDKEIERFKKKIQHYSQVLEEQERIVEQAHQHPDWHRDRKSDYFKSYNPQFVSLNYHILTSRKAKIDIKLAQRSLEKLQKLKKEQEEKEKNKKEL